MARYEVYVKTLRVVECHVSFDPIGEDLEVVNTDERGDNELTATRKHAVRRAIGAGRFNRWWSIFLLSQPTGNFEDDQEVRLIS